MKSVLRALLAAAFVTSVWALAPMGAAVGQVAEPAEERVPGPLAGIGEDLWRAQISCWNCHGNLANGRNEDPRSPQGPNLRETFLNEELLAETIRCGRPGTPMPAFGRNAYSENAPCYGLTTATVGDRMPPTGAETLNTRQLQALAQFIVYQFVGKGAVTREECVAFYGASASSCSRWPTEAELAATPVPAP